MLQILKAISQRLWGISVLGDYQLSRSTKYEREELPVPLASYRCTLTKCETSIINKLSTLAEPSKRANKDVFINQTDITCSSGSSSNL